MVSPRGRRWSSMPPLQHADQDQSTFRCGESSRRLPSDEQTLSVASMLLNAAGGRANTFGAAVRLNECYLNAVVRKSCFTCFDVNLLRVARGNSG